MRLGLRELTGVRTVNLIHVAKAGVTAVREALSRHEGEGPYLVEVHKHGFTLADVPPGGRAAFFVRDPASRFVSAFNHHQRQGGPRYEEPWKEGEREAFERFGTANSLAGALYSDDREEETAARSAVGSILHLKRPLTHWLKGPEYLRRRWNDVFFVGRQESLAADFARFCRLLELDGPALPADPIAANRSPGGQETSLDEVALANLRRWYGPDYECLAAIDELERSRPARAGVGAD